jgi:hypothetical protein
MDAPEVEKELKRLLRTDLEANAVRWEVLSVSENMASVALSYRISRVIRSSYRTRTECKSSSTNLN